MAQYYSQLYHRKDFTSEKAKTHEARVFKGPWLYEQRGARQNSLPYLTRDQLDQWEATNMLLKQDVLDQELNEDRQEPLLITYDNPSVQNAAVLSMTLPGMPNLRDIYIKVSPSKPQPDQHNRIAYSTLVLQMAGLLTEQIKYLTDYKDPSPLDQASLAALYDLC